MVILINKTFLEVKRGKWVPSVYSNLILPSKSPGLSHNSNQGWRNEWVMITNILPTLTQQLSIHQMKEKLWAVHIVKWIIKLKSFWGLRKSIQIACNYTLFNLRLSNNQSHSTTLWVACSPQFLSFLNWVPSFSWAHPNSC